VPDHHPDGPSFCKVGYEDPTSFRRLFKCMTRITPRTCRHNFRVPEFARAKTRKPGGA
jgi:AraC-like DNA-binding protein